MTKEILKPVKVKACPICKCEFTKSLEPHLVESHGAIGAGLTCPKCAYKIEWVLIGALPMQPDMVAACLGAIGQLISVSWNAAKNLTVCNKVSYENAIEGIPMAEEMFRRHKDELNKQEGDK